MTWGRLSGVLIACAFAFSIGAIVFAPSTAFAGSRIALVIGNSAYEQGSLRNPANDARLIGNTLKSLGFEVLLHTDLDYRDMKRAFLAYYAKLRNAENNTVGVVFYAGHGVQVRGHNFLIPIDANIAGESDIEVNAINASNILRGLSHIGNRLNIIILDACRNNPYRSLFRSPATGLAQMNAPTGSLVAFSTAPGSVAGDGENSANSPYSTALAKEMGRRGVVIEQIFKKVREEVYRSTGKRQVPWESSSVMGDFYFARGDEEKANLEAVQRAERDNEEIELLRILANDSKKRAGREKHETELGAKREACNSDNPPILCLWNRR